MDVSYARVAKPLLSHKLTHGDSFNYAHNFFWVPNKALLTYSNKNSTINILMLMPYNAGRYVAFLSIKQSNTIPFCTTTMP